VVVVVVDRHHHLDIVATGVLETRRPGPVNEEQVSVPGQEPVVPPAKSHQMDFLVAALELGLLEPAVVVAEGPTPERVAGQQTDHNWRLLEPVPQTAAAVVVVAVGHPKEMLAVVQGPWIDSREREMPVPVRRIHHRGWTAAVTPQVAAAQTPHQRDYTLHQQQQQQQQEQAAPAGQFADKPAASGGSDRTDSFVVVAAVVVAVAAVEEADTGLQRPTDRRQEQALEQGLEQPWVVAVASRDIAVAEEAADITAAATVVVAVVVAAVGEDTADQAGLHTTVAHRDSEHHILEWAQLMPEQAAEQHCY
jgi:hypothetical protein